MGWDFAAGSLSWAVQGDGSIVRDGSQVLCEAIRCKSHRIQRSIKQTINPMYYCASALLHVFYDKGSIT